MRLTTTVGCNYNYFLSEQGLLPGGGGVRADASFAFCFRLAFLPAYCSGRRDSFYLRTPLHDAAHYGQVDVVRVLLDAGADPNAPDLYGKTTVQFALGLQDNGGDFQWVRCIRPGCEKWRKLPATVREGDRTHFIFGAVPACAGSVCGVCMLATPIE